MSNRVIPILRLAVLCERVGTDKEDRPYFCVPVHTIQFPPGVATNYEPPSLELYLQLQEALGAFNLTAIVEREGEGIELFRTKPLSLDFSGTEYQNVPLELALGVKGLVFPTPGVYELRIYANHVSLHDPDRQPGWPFPPLRITVFAADGSEGGVR